MVADGRYMVLSDPHGNLSGINIDTAVFIRASLLEVGKALAIALGLVLALGGSQEQEPEEVVPLELAVNRTIALAVDYLRGRQHPDGSHSDNDGSVSHAHQKGAQDTPIERRS